MNRNIKWLEYENDITFHIPNYSTPIQFVNVGFLVEDLNGKDENFQEVDEGVHDVSNKVDGKQINEILDKFQHSHKLAIWKLNSLTSIFIYILGRNIIFLTNTKRRRRFINEQFILVGLVVSDGI